MQQTHKLRFTVLLVFTILTFVGCTATTQQNTNDLAITNSNDSAELGTQENLEESNSSSSIITPEAMATKDPSNFQQWEESPANQLTEGKSYFAVLKTNLGDIKIELDAETRPVTVNNFVFLSKEGFYDGVIFHRIIPNFMAQGGDPTGTGMGGPGYQFEDEIDDENSNAPYTISMANAGPGTNGSQFFINFVDNGYLNTAHTVFGTVIEGKEVVDTMNGVQTDFKDKPVDPIVIQSVVIEEV